jgi:hypothetical protein
VYADGHPLDNDSCCKPTTFVVTGNVFEGNAHALLAYFQSYGLVLNNVFQDNSNALVSASGSEQILVLENNSFSGNSDYDIWSAASRVFAAQNVFHDGLSCATEYVQRGEFSCNVVVGNASCELITIGQNGNVSITADDDPLQALPSDCYDSAGQ